MARVLADATMVVHFVTLVYIVFGAYLAWRWPKSIFVHLPFALWGLGIALLSFPCPLTTVENHFRARAGQQGPGDGFIERYLGGVLYPGDQLALAQSVGAVVAVVGYLGVVVLWYRRHRSATATSWRRWSGRGTGVRPD